jgi:hypothetical protein
VCRLEQQSVERYLDQHFYENVNSPAWRERLRGSLGFCHEHAWLGVNQRLGDALGFTIVYHDLINTILSRLDSRPARAPRGPLSFLGQLPESVREMIEKALSAVTPLKSCPVCEHREQATDTLLDILAEELRTPELAEALQASDGLCLPHLRLALRHLKDAQLCERLLTLQRAKLESLRTELAEFIRKNDYQVIQEGFGEEGDAWLRAVALITGSRKKG